MSRSLPQHLVTLLLLAMAVSLPAFPARSAPPATLKYEGNLMTAADRPLATGQYSIRFALYTSPTGGEPIWNELHTKVLVKNGAFEAVLGKGDAARPLDLPFDRQYYLGVSVDGEPELVPRVELMPTPYSFHARHADQVSDGSVTSAKLAPGAVTDDKIRSVSWSKITGVNGTAGVPAGIWSLKGNSSSDPGVDFIGTTDAADLTFRTNNAPRFSIRSGGDGEFFSDFHSVGRITSRPSQGGGAFLFGDQTVGLERPGSSPNLRLFGPSSGSFVFDGGNVGIGASNPASKLEVAGGATLRENLQVDGRADVTGAAGVGGTLSVGGATSLRDALRVTGATTLQSSLAAAGATSLGGTLAVSGRASLADETESTGSGTGALVVSGGAGIGKSLRIGKDLVVAGATTLTGAVTTVGGGKFGSLEVSPGSATIAGDATIAGNVFANRLNAGAGGVSSNGPVVVDANLDANGDPGARGAYPLRVQGSAQGVWIEVNSEPGTTPDKSNHFVTFVGKETSRIHGRITGLTPTENEQEEQYKWERSSLIIQTVLAGVDVITAAADIIAAVSSATACVGLGACVTAPIPSLIVTSIAQAVTASLGAGHAAGDLTAWMELQRKLTENGGVTYSSASADYAEWLPKADPAEKIFPGDVVGIHRGRASKRTAGADMLMVASTRPLVLGNVPPEGREADHVKVAFMGQVPVKVFGGVGLGDYLVPSGNDNGYAVARRADDLAAADLARVVGVAWTASTSSGLDYVNTAVGLDRASVARIAERQESRLRAQASEIDELKLHLQQSHTALARLVPGYEDAVRGTSPSPASAPVPARVAPASGRPATALAHDVAPGPAAAVPPGAPIVSRYDVELGIRQAIENLRRSGATPENNPILRQLLEPNIVEEMRAKIQASLVGQLAPGR